MGRNKRCYISGKISGLPIEVAKRNFTFTDDYIGTKLKLHPVNPMKKKIPDNSPWLLHMVLDIALLCVCRYVYFQANWQESRGARIEMRIAKRLKKEIFFETVLI